MATGFNLFNNGANKMPNTGGIQIGSGQPNIGGAGFQPSGQGILFQQPTSQQQPGLFQNTAQPQQQGLNLFQNPQGQGLGQAQAQGQNLLQNTGQFQQGLGTNLFQQPSLQQQPQQPQLTGQLSFGQGNLLFNQNPTGFNTQNQMNMQVQNQDQIKAQHNRQELNQVLKNFMSVLNLNELKSQEDANGQNQQEIIDALSLFRAPCFFFQGQGPKKQYYVAQINQQRQQQQQLEIPDFPRDLYEQMFQKIKGKQQNDLYIDYTRSSVKLNQHVKEQNQQLNKKIEEIQKYCNEIQKLRENQKNLKEELNSVQLKNKFIQNIILNVYQLINKLALHNNKIQRDINEETRTLREINKLNEFSIKLTTDIKGIQKQLQVSPLQNQQNNLDDNVLLNSTSSQQQKALFEMLDQMKKGIDVLQMQVNKQQQEYESINIILNQTNGMNRY